MYSLRPAGEVVVDRVQELERRGQPHVGDRRRVAADERPAVEEERAEDVERLGERLGGGGAARLAFAASSASEEPTSPGYCGKPSAG